MSTWQSFEDHDQYAPKVKGQLLVHGKNKNPQLVT
jgi:hypothetical protein